MKCDQIQPNLLDYAQGSLSASNSEYIKAHISECKECAALLEEEVAFSKSLAAIPQEHPVNDVWPLICARTTPKFSPIIMLRKMMATNIRKATAASVAVAVAAIAIYSVKPIDQIPNEKPAKHHTITVKWSDDPLGNNTDAIIESINDM